MASPSCLSLPADLEDARIRTLPGTAYYIADFITKDEEQIILSKIASAPKPRWKQLTHRRLQTWPSDLVQDKLIDATLPVWLSDPIIPRLKSLRRTHKPASPDVFSSSPHQQPNHVLVNEYTPGVGIMPHKDGSAYYPVVCTVSLGASICLDIHRNKQDGALDPEPAYRIVQEPRSLLITTDELYTDYLHGIAHVTLDTNLSEKTVANWTLLRSGADFPQGCNVRTTRTSLTYRDVMKVSKLGSKLAMFQKK